MIAKFHFSSKYKIWAHFSADVLILLFMEKMIASWSEESLKVTTHLKNACCQKDSEVLEYV